MERFIFGVLLVVALSLSGTGADPQCPVTWSFYDGHCYKLFKQLKNWGDAERFCRQEEEGAHLASIHSKRERDFVAEMVSRKVYLLNVWIGLWASWKPRFWRWSNGYSFRYESWALGEPNNFLWSEYCVTLTSISGYLKWNDQNCGFQCHFICKFQPQGEGST
uniref:C-type lectin n=1 Tax=Phalotris mertensi TaxID=1260334 RepID=A0A182C5T5_9SAUR